MNKHTPGPWHLVLSDNATPFIQHEQGHDWTDIDERSSRICHMPTEIMESFNSLNNARLIAAAPDLLDALEVLYGLIDESKHDLPLKFAYAHGKAFAAIAKARGQS